MLGDAVTFIPGLNLINTEILAALRKNEMFERNNFMVRIPASPAPEQNPEKVGKTPLEVMRVPAPAKDGKPVEGKFMDLEVEDTAPLAKLSPEVAKLVIDETLSAELLRQWTAEEVRPGVRFEAQRKLELLTAKPAGPASVGR